VGYVIDIDSDDSFLDLPLPRYASRGWLYFVARAEDGTVLVIARRDGPAIQILDREGQWIDWPQLLTRFHDPGYLEEATRAEAQGAAARLGITWPS
jgi:hypothetical protein